MSYTRYHVAGVSDIFIPDLGGGSTPSSGSDGVVVFDGVIVPPGSVFGGGKYTLTRDVFYTTAHVSAGITFDPSSFRIFASVSFQNDGIVDGDGVAGGDGANGVPGAAGVNLNIHPGYIVAFTVPITTLGSGDPGGVGVAGGATPGHPGGPVQGIKFRWKWRQGR